MQNRIDPICVRESDHFRVLIKVRRHREFRFQSRARYIFYSAAANGGRNLWQNISGLVGAGR